MNLIIIIFNSNKKITIKFIKAIYKVKKPNFLVFNIKYTIFWLG